MKTNKLLLLLLLALIYGCSDSDETPVPANEYLLSSSEKFGRSKSEIESLFELGGLGSFSSFLEYDVQLYEIEYETDYLGETITASGLLIYPLTDVAVPIMSFQHGTMASHKEAPTRNTIYSTLGNLASAGYIMIIPDLIGFGSSDDVFHPYYHKPTTAAAVVDMLQAAKEFARTTDGLNFNGEVFLSGYSQGGYATMAAHQLMEETDPEGLTLIASAPASGGYDIKGVQEFFFAQETYDQPFYMAYVALSYLSVNPDWTLTLADMFNEPYATNIPILFNGSSSGSLINSSLTDVVQDLLTTEFYNDLDTDPKFSVVVDAFEENSVHDWVPQVRMMLYHGDADITVPYQNSVDTYNNMMDIGASTDVVTFTTLAGGTHGSGFLPYLEDFLTEFDNLK